jgi:hypothetical protein
LKLKNVIDGEVEKNIPRVKYMGKMKKKVCRKKYQEISQLALDRVEWRADVH